MANAFEHNRAVVFDPVERFSPTAPVDRSLTRGEVSVFSAVVVVDMGGEMVRAGLRGFVLDRSAQMSMSRIKRQAEVGPSDLPNQPSEVRHRRAWFDSRRHILNAKLHLGAQGMIRQDQKTLTQRRGTGLAFLVKREAAGMDDQTGSAGPVEPVDATSNFINTFRSDRYVEAREIDPRRLDGLAPPTTMRAVDQQTGIGRDRSDRLGVGQGSPVGKDLDGGRSKRVGDREIGLEQAVPESVGNHGAKEASRLIPARHVEGNLEGFGDQGSCFKRIGKS